MDSITNICQTCLSADRQLVSTSRIRRVLRKIKYKELQNIESICWECHSIITKFYIFTVQVKKVQVALNNQLQHYKSYSKLIHTAKNEYDYEFIYDSDTCHISNDKKTEPKMIKQEMFEYASELSIFDYSDSDSETKSKTLVSIKEENSKHKLISKENRINKSEVLKEKRSLNNKTNALIKEKRSLKHKTNALIKEKRSLNVKTNVAIEERRLHNKTKDIKKTRSLNNKKNVAIKEKSSLIQNKKKTNEEDTKGVKNFKMVKLTEEELLRSREEKRNQPNYKKIPFKCDTCVLGFTVKINYDLHLEKKHSEGIGHHICRVCSTRFPTETSLHRHCSKHYLHYVCVLCSYKAYSSTAAANHCRDKHENDELDKIHCKQCTAVLRTALELEEHMRTKHTLYCNDCGEPFKGKHTLRSHLVRIHAVKREFVCEICNRSFLTKSRLESHITKHSQTLAKRLAYCSLCRVQYKNIHVYRNHVQNSANHARNRYQCPECNKKFASKVYWTKHYNFYHLKKSQYKCESCNKLFISEWRLKNHKQIHHGLSRTRVHGCTECDKKFYTLSTLRGHQLTHSSKREFMCHHCGDTFKQRPALYTHARLVHKEK